MIRRRLDTTLELLKFKKGQEWTRSILAGFYSRALEEGYEMAVTDFFGATKRNGEYDENWHDTQPSLRRRQGAIKRYYGA